MTARSKTDKFFIDMYSAGTSCANQSLKLGIVLTNGGVLVQYGVSRFNQQGLG